MQDYTVIGLPSPDLTEAQFIAVLQKAGSPALGAASAVWNYCLRRGVSCAFLLAMFKVESSFGLQGTATQTRSWGNTRLPNFGGVPDMGTVPGRSGVFPVFANWIDGGISTVARWLDHAPYQGKTTVAQIIPVWAPPTDQNDTPAYIKAVLASIESWVGGATMPQIADRAVLDWSGDNRPKTPLRGFHACVAHETANEKAGANAQMHVTYVTKNGGGGASFHLVADKDESVQLLTTGEVGYHIGDGANDPDDEAFYTIGGEICVNDKAGYPAACRNMAQAFARVLEEKGRPVIDGVTLRQHGSYWSANRNPEVHQGCPQHMKARGGLGDWGVSWAQFVGMVREELEALSLAPAVLGESMNQKLLFDTVARDYTGDEAARYLGSLVREGLLRAKSAGFGGTDAERVAIYQKGALHTLGGDVYAFFDEAAAAVDPALASATVAGLLANGYIELYG